MKREELLKFSYKQEFILNEEAKILYDYIVENIDINKNTKYLSGVAHVKSRNFVFFKTREYFNLYFEIDMHEALKSSKLKTKIQMPVIDVCIDMLSKTYKVKIKTFGNSKIEIITKVYSDEMDKQILLTRGF